MSKSKTKSKAKLSPEKTKEINEQVEYYLSDDNLSKDTFFHELISGSPDGYINLDVILKCNKIKANGWTKDEIKTALKSSTLIELDETENQIRRKGNPPLPKLELLNKKRKNPEKENNKKAEPVKDADNKDPVILRMTCEKKTESSWKNIIDQFKTLNPELNVIYARFKETEGHVGIILNSSQNADELKYTEKFELDGIEYTVKNCEGEDLIEFWKNHGTHYEFCTKKKLRNDAKKNNKKMQKSQKNSNYLDEAVKLGESEYKDVASIKNDVRKMINSYKDDEKLSDKDQKYILDLLKYHHNYEDKVKDMDHIIVGKCEEYAYSRCFIVVKKNKDKVDFSAKKCIDCLVEAANK